MPPEIDDGEEYIGYKEALDMVFSGTAPIGTEIRGIGDCAGRVAAEDISARVNSPTDDVSLKDGFAVSAGDVARASAIQPARLSVVGLVFAGHRFEGLVKPGSAVKICSGFPLPAGTDTVVASEFCYESGDDVYVGTSTARGQNLFPAGGDIKKGEIVALSGQTLLPARLGLIAAAGHHQLKVYRQPKVAMLGIGDEVIAPGQPLKEGQLYASNLVNIGTWLSLFDISCESALALDSKQAIQSELRRCIAVSDAIITSGGAWGSERDLVVGALDELGWRRLFHHVRIGPGKGIAFGLWQNKPVFCLPGGPPSNQMAFLQLALPGILRLGGHCGPALPVVQAAMTEELTRRHLKWTEFKSGKLTRDQAGNYLITPYSEISRLKSMADTDCLICIPEGVKALHAGQVVPVQMLSPMAVHACSGG